MLASFESRDEESHQPEPGHPVAGEDVGGAEQGEGRAKEEVTPKIGEDAEMEQTTQPAPDDDVGIPEDSGREKE